MQQIWQMFACRLNLAEGRFLSPLPAKSPGINACGISQVHGLFGCAGEDGVLECFDLRKRTSIGTLNAAAAAGAVSLLLLVNQCAYRPRCYFCLSVSVVTDRGEEPYVTLWTSWLEGTGTCSGRHRTILWYVCAKSSMLPLAVHATGSKDAKRMTVCC